MVLNVVTHLLQGSNILHINQTKILILHINQTKPKIDSSTKSKTRIEWLNSQQRAKGVFCETEFI